MPFPSMGINNETDKELDFWLFLARVALNKEVIEKCVFAGDTNYSAKDFSDWVSECFSIKQHLLSYPFEVPKYDTNLIYNLEIIMNSHENLSEAYKDIFYFYKKRPLSEEPQDDDLYECDYEYEESSPE